MLFFLLGDDFFQVVVGIEGKINDINMHSKPQIKTLNFFVATAMGASQTIPDLDSV